MDPVVQTILVRLLHSGVVVDVVTVVVVVDEQ